MKFFLIVSLLLISPPLFAQDLSGTWEGKPTNTFNAGAQYLKIVLLKCGDTYTGYTYDSGPGFCQANFSGFYNEENGRLTGENRGMIRNSPTHHESRYNLRYSRAMGEDFLDGMVGGKGFGLQSGFSLDIGSRVRYVRISKSVDTTAYMQKCVDHPPVANPESPVAKDTLAKKPVPVEPDTFPAITKPKPVLPDTLFPKPLVQGTDRKKEIISTISTDASEITISIFDNGQVDGDTISVLHNNQIIANRLGVTAKPYKFSISIDAKHPRHEIVMIAHNLGSIPPNTAMVIIDAGDKKYTLTTSSDMKTNGVIIFEFRK